VCAAVGVAAQVRKPVSLAPPLLLLLVLSLLVLLVLSLLLRLLLFLVLQFGS